MTVEVSTLASGLRVVTDSAPQADSVVLGVWVGAGSRDDPPGFSGSAHLFEHMAFKGLPDRSAQEVFWSIEAAGGRINAETTREDTIYRAKVTPSQFETTLRLLSAMFGTPGFSESDVARERDIIVRETALLRSDPDLALFDAVMAAAYPTCGLGRSITGDARDLRRLNAGALQEVLQRTYVPSNMVVVVAGACDHRQVISALEAGLLDSGRRGDPVLDRAQAEPVAVRKVIAKRGREARLGLGFPGVPVEDPMFMANQIWNFLLTSRGLTEFHEVLEDEVRFTSHGHCQHFTWRDGALFYLQLATSADTAAQARRRAGPALLEVTSKFDASHVARARTQLRSWLLMREGDLEARARGLGQQLFVHGRLIPVQELVDRLAKVSPEDVHAVAERVLAKSPTTVVMGPPASRSALTNEAAASLVH